MEKTGKEIERKQEMATEEEKENEKLMEKVNSTEIHTISDSDSK